MMMADYGKIVDILKRCSSQEVSQAENELKKLIKQDVQILAILQQILKDYSLSKTIILTAITNINSIFSSNISDFSSEFSFNFFSHLLEDPAIQIWSKKELLRSIINCIDECSEGKWKSLALTHVMNEELHDVGLMILVAFSCVNIEDNLLNEIDSQPFDFTMKLLGHKYDFADHSEKILSRFENWKTILENMIDSESSTAFNLLVKKMADSEGLTRVLEIAYKKLSTGNDKHYLYINDQDYQMTEKVNEMKKTVLEFHFLVLNETLSYKKSFLYQFTSLQIELFINTLCYSSMQEGIISEFCLEGVIIEILRIARIISLDCPFILKKTWKEMIHYILIPFMRINSTELEYFEEDTNSFVEINEDCCEKQKMGIIKTEACHFLEKLSDNSLYIIQSCSEEEKEKHIPRYIIRFAIASIEQQLQISDICFDEFLLQEKIPPSAPVLSIETSFLVLSIFSFCLGDFPLEIERIKQILCHKKVSVFPPLEKARIYTFLAYNYEEIFTFCNHASAKNWINLALMEESHPTVSYCALDFLTNALEIVYDEGFILNIIQRIQPNTSTHFWVLLKKMIQMFMLKLSESTLIALVNEIFARIEKEVNFISHQKVKITFVITSLLHPLRNICEKLNLFESYSSLITLLEKIELLYPVALNNYFEDEVVKVMNCFLFFNPSNQNQIHRFHAYLPEFSYEFSKNHFEQTFYFVSFNCMVMNGEFEKTVLPIFFVLKNSIVFHIENSVSKKEKSQKIEIGHTLLLLQNIIAIHGNSIPIEELEFISTVVEIFYPSLQKAKTVDGKTCSKLIIYDNTLLGRALNLQFLCFLFTCNTTFLVNLKKYHHLKVFNGYEMSVIVSCFGVLFCKESGKAYFCEALQIMVNVVDCYLTREAEEKVKFLQSKKKEFDCDEEIGEEEEGQENEGKMEEQEVYKTKISEFEMILAEIDTPFMKPGKRTLGDNKRIKQVEDIKQEVTDLLKKINDSNFSVFNSTLNSFPQEMKEKLWRITSDKSIEELCEPKRKIYKVLDYKKGNVCDEGDVEERGKREICGSFEWIEEDEEEEELYKGELTKKKKKSKQNY